MGATTHAPSDMSPRGRCWTPRSLNCPLCVSPASAETPRPSGDQDVPRRWRRRRHRPSRQGYGENRLNPHRARDLRAGQLGVGGCRGQGQEVGGGGAIHRDPQAAGFSLKPKHPSSSLPLLPPPLSLPQLKRATPGPLGFLLPPSPPSLPPGSSQPSPQRRIAGKPCPCSAPEKGDQPPLEDMEEGGTPSPTPYKSKAQE